MDGPVGQHESLQRWADEVFGPALHRVADEIRIEAYTPQTAADPYLNLAGETGKLLIVQADFADRDHLESTMRNPVVTDTLAAIRGSRDVRVTAEAMTARHFPIRDGSTPPRRAPLSFVVRYYPPIEDAAGFTAYYVDHHPPIMVGFPRVRNILCYFPVDWDDAGQVTPSESFLGNELVFDNIEDLNSALASDVRHDLRADYRLFPPHEGKNSHHAMLRRVISPEYPAVPARQE